MSNFNIVVYNNPILYDILYEIKNILNINLNSHIKEKSSLIKFANKNPLTLVISSQKVDVNINNIIINKPIKVSMLIEKINVILSKSNFKIQSNFLLNDYNIDINSRFLIKGALKLKLTQREVELIQYLKNCETEVTPQNLQTDIWKHHEEVETHTVETHIYRLRKKIFEKFQDNNFIISNNKGYKIKK